MSEPMWAIDFALGLGHVRIAGRVTEEERFGGKLGRIDIPGKDGGETTQYFNASSIYRLTPTTEEIARHVAINCQPMPVQPWDLPKPAITYADPLVNVDNGNEIGDMDAGYDIEEEITMPF